MGHIHAAAMAEYAKDAAETDKPWERWEFSYGGQEKYFALESDPCWATGTKYRRKAKTTLLYDIARIAELEEQLSAGGVEPLCWHWENTSTGGMGVVKKNPETLGINMSHPDYKWAAIYTAPQPAAQGLDAQTIKHISALSELVRMPNAEHFADAHNAAVRHLRVIAAQAKQGG